MLEGDEGELVVRFLGEEGLGLLEGDEGELVVRFLGEEVFWLVAGWLVEVVEFNVVFDGRLVVVGDEEDRGWSLTSRRSASAATIPPIE